MLEASKKQVKNFANFLRKKLITDGCHRKYVTELSDSQILDDFRLCCDCGEEIHSKDQQLHAILEFESPERAFEVLYEEEASKSCSTEDDEWDEQKDDENEDEDEYTIILRGKYIFDGADTLGEALELLEDYKLYLESLLEDGFELIDSVEDDYGHLRRTEK